MMSSAKTLGTLSVVGLVLGGCATVPRDAGFADVQSQVSERIGKRVQWRQPGADDQAVDDAVKTILSEELTADRAVQLALLNNRRLQAVYEELGIARSQLVQAGLLRNPVFRAAVLYHHERGRPDLNLGIAQDFLSIFFLPLRRQLAQAEFEAAKLRVTGAVIELAAETQTGFYRTQADAQTVELLRQVVQATGFEFEAARRLHEAGNITDLALNQQRALFEESRLGLAAAEANLAIDRERLNDLMGLWGSQTEWKVTQRLPEIPEQALDFADLEKRAVAASLDLAAVRQQTLVSARQLGVANVAAWLQPLEIGAEFEREDDHWRRGPSIELPLPLFDFGQGRRAAAQAIFRQLEQAYRAQAISVRAAARATAQSLAAARARTLHVRNVLLPVRTRVLSETQLQYNAMQVGIFQLLQAKREQIATAIEYIESSRDYWLASTELQQIFSGRTSGVAAGRFNVDMIGAPGGRITERSGLASPGAPGRAETGGH